MRFSYSDDQAGQLGAAIARFIQLRSIGAVLADMYRSVASNLASATHNITSCGFVPFSTGHADAQQLSATLSKLFESGCR